jgi:Sad1 / UNC-like C-terminal
MLSALPIFLLVLLFAFPISSTNSSANDPFRALSFHARKAKQDPVCCLKPLPSVESQPSEDELLLSFEDWKAKLLAEERSAANDNASTGWNPGKDSVDVGNGRNRSSDPPSVIGTLAIPSVGISSVYQDQSDANEQLSPHFRVPLTDRFNYASLDCSARVHTSHRSAKSAASILSSTKDRYMLSPCSTKSSDGKEENHFVVVELCDDIRIDTVQLANFEFFSGVFKDLTVSVAKTYTTEPEGWINAGTYRAKNVRGVQVSTRLSYSLALAC